MKVQPWPEILRPYKQTAIAEQLGVSISTVHDWYHGNFYPGAEHYVKLAAFLRVSVEDLAQAIADDTMRRNLERVSAAEGAA